MALQIKWTENALEDYKAVVDYLLKGWQVDVAAKFINLAEARVDALSIFPNIGKVSLKEKKVRSIVLTKHNKLYYRVSDNCIEVLNIFDTRQNPAKNKYD